MIQQVEYTAHGTHCPKCYRPYIYIGDIPPNGFTEGFEPYCTCNVKKETSKNIGWICPVCGAGLSPFITVCPCKAFDNKIMC